MNWSVSEVGSDVIFLLVAKLFLLDMSHGRDKYRQDGKWENEKENGYFQR